jgi:L-ascorbate metabolism protein UlaG (beta-lactamase superfamily)
MIEQARRKGKQYVNPVPTAVGSWTIFPRILWRYLTNKAERTPRRPPGPFRTDAEVYRQPPATGLRVTWFGHSSLLVEIDGARVLVDPMWDERAAPVEWAGPRRFFDAPLPVDALPRIDVVLISHDHYDHLGAQTVRRLAGLSAVAEARWVTSMGVGPILARLGARFGLDPGRITELDWTGCVRLGPLAITALPTRHFSGRSVWNRFETLWASFVIEGPDHCVYYGADSGEWSGFAEIARRYGPFDLTMLEIGAYDPMWADIHMGPEGAARTFQAMGAAGLLMPIHWGLFDLALHGWRQPIEQLYGVKDLRLWAPEPGAPTEVEPGVEVRSTWWR